MKPYIRRSSRGFYGYTIDLKKFLRFLVILVVLTALLTLIFSWNRMIYPQYKLSDVDTSVLEMYLAVEEDQGVPWYYLAAVDRAEGVEGEARSKERSSRIAIYLQGVQEFEEMNSLLKEYRNDRGFLKKAQKEIKRFETLGSIYENKVFPIAAGYNYDYSDGYGDGRTYGGDRKHEGIDIMCDKGVPLVSVGDGVIEKKGWNNLGGWRIGIRGDDGIYYYYAHMSRYNDKLEKGDRVRQGEIIGYAGDSGYGEEGTVGQFAPHLHFGMYEGRAEKAVNPFPLLKAWERRTFENDNR